MYCYTHYIYYHIYLSMEDWNTMQKFNLQKINAKTLWLRYYDIYYSW